MAKLHRAIELLAVPGALRSALTWKKFSLAAYQILLRLNEAGVKPATVIDIGANVGQFSVAAGHLLPAAVIHPVEPDPATAERLRDNLPARIASNIVVSAIGDRIGSVDFQVNSDSQVSSVLALGEGRKHAFPGDSVQKTMRVPLTTLDALFAGKPLVAPVLLKIDVQGYEDRVIEGASQLLHSVRWIVMELSFARLYEGEKDFPGMLEMMNKRGFRFVRPLDFHTSGKTGAIIEMDALFENVAMATHLPQ